LITGYRGYNTVGWRRTLYNMDLKIITAIKNKLKILFLESGVSFPKCLIEYDNEFGKIVLSKLQFEVNNISQLKGMIGLKDYFDILKFDNKKNPSPIKQKGYAG